MYGVWCSNCKENVILSAAIERLPCPQCRGTEYTILAADDESVIAINDARAEFLMQTGQWDEAADVYSTCTQLEPSELNLRLATLQWRHDCAEYINRTLDEPTDVQDFKQDILDRYDSFVVDWVLKSYRGIRLVPEGNVYKVTRRNNP